MPPPSLLGPVRNGLRVKHFILLTENTYLRRPYRLVFVQGERSGQARRTRRGQPVAMVLSIAEFERLSATRREPDWNLATLDTRVVSSSTATKPISAEPVPLPCTWNPWTPTTR